LLLAQQILQQQAAQSIASAGPSQNAASFLYQTAAGPHGGGGLTAHQLNAYAQQLAAVSPQVLQVGQPSAFLPQALQQSMPASGMYGISKYGKKR